MPTLARFTWIWVLGLAGAIALTLPAMAADKPDAAAITKLIQLLGSDKFQEREDAAEQLTKIGEPAFEALKTAAREHKDPEVRLRAERILQSFQRAKIVNFEARRFEVVGKQINKVVLSPDGTRLYTSGPQEGLIRVWEVKTGKEQKPLGDNQWTSVLQMALSPDGKKILAVGREKVIRLLDAATGKEEKSFQGKATTYYGLAFSPDGRQFASSGTKELILWDIEKKKDVHHLEVPAGIIRSLAFTADGKQLLSSGTGAKARLTFWDTQTGKEDRTAGNNVPIVYAAALMPDGKSILAVGTTDKTLRLYDAKTFKETKNFQDHVDYVYALAVSPDGKYALSAGGRIATTNPPMGQPTDYTIRLWDLEAGKVIQRLEGHTNSVHALTFTPDGKMAVSGSYDGTARLWKLLLK